MRYKWHWHLKKSTKVNFRRGSLSNNKKTGIFIKDWWHDQGRSVQRHTNKKANNGYQLPFYQKSIRCLDLQDLPETTVVDWLWLIIAPLFIPSLPCDSAVFHPRGRPFNIGLGHVILTLANRLLVEMTQSGPWSLFVHWGMSSCISAIATRRTCPG